ncbi:hypothetical protein ABT131_08935 [Streptomyces sp900105245]|uniref:hypothetical protein n=1 Tax=Streptomyces sp. 900105245 TaxID=3154379 RepID=UPI00332BF588
MSVGNGSQGKSAWHSFEWWQSRLAREFFGEDRSGIPVLFFIDEAELLTLHDQEQVPELRIAVSSVLAWHGNPYEPVSARCRAWKRGTRQDPPPCLPLLAATVLAAANMRRTELGPGAPAYYARLAEVLQPPWGNRAQHKHQLQQHYDTVVELWVCLDQWLREKTGARGLSTIKKNPTYTKIGYAQSQALVRASDHAALTSFFRSADLSPGQPVDGATLLRDLAVWSTRHPQGLSQGLRRALVSDSERPLLEPLLVALLESWDDATTQGSIDGLRRVPLRVVVEDGWAGWEIRWHAETVPGVEADVLQHPNGELNLASGAEDQAYVLSGAVPEVADALQCGFTARGQKTAVRVESGRKLMALREEPVAGGWVETDVLAVSEPYVFLFTPSGQRQLQALLADAGLRWYRPEDVPLPGWQITPALEFKDAPALAEALARSGIQNVRHTTANLLSLRNGLRVRPEWRQRSHFLLGGEPDLMVPKELRKPGLVTLDGDRLDVPAEGLVELRGRGLRPGRHVLAADGTELTFYLERLIAPQSDRATAPTPAEPAAAVVVPLAGDSRFLTAQGRYLAILHAQEPAWWRERAPDLCGGGTVRVPIPPTAVWLVTIPASGTPSVKLLRREEPDISSLSRPAKEFWSKIVLLDQAGTSHATLWRRYREAVLSQFPRGRFGRV